MKKIDILSSIAVIAAGSLWGSIGIFIRILNEIGFDSFEIVELRACVTALILFLALSVSKRDLLKIKLCDIWCFLGTGVGSIVFFNYCYFKTITISSLSVAAILLYTAPAMVMIMSFFLFKERFTIRKLFALMLAFLGCICVSGVGGADKVSPQVLLTGLGAGFGYALYSIFSRFALQKGYSSITISAYTFLFAVLGGLPFINTYEIVFAVGNNPESINFIILFGIVTTVAPYALYTWGMKHMENGKASILASVEPVVATIISVFVFGEALKISAISGIILIIISILFCEDKKILKR